MAQRKTKPRSVLIYRYQFENDLTAAQIAPRSSGDFAQTIYTAMLKLEPQTQLQFEKLASRLNDLKELGLNDDDLRYDDEALDAEDRALQLLIGLPDDHKLTQLLKSQIANDERTRKSGIEMKPVGFIYYLVSNSHDGIQTEISSQAKKWSGDAKELVTQFFDLISAAIKQRTPETNGETPNDRPWRQAEPIDDPHAEDPKIKEDEAATRQLLTEYASNVLAADSKTLSSICRHFELAEGAAFLASSRMFPPEKAQAATDDAINPTFQHFLQVVFAVAKRNLHAERATLLKLRDVAICLTLPRRHVFEALKQSQSDSGFTKLPTADLEVAKLIIARALGRIPGRTSKQVPPNALRDRIVKGDEGIVEVTDQLLLEMSGTTIVVDEPPASWIEDTIFISDFCLGLAKAIHVGFDMKDKAVPPANLKDINDALELFSVLEVKICVFMTTERPAAIGQLRSWFPQLNFIRVADCEHAEYTRLKYQVKLFDDKITEHFSIDEQPFESAGQT